MTGSWKTSLVGYIMIASGIIAFIAETVAKSGIPDTIMEWVTFGTLIVGGIVGILAKDGDVSNAPQPVAPAVVSSTNAVKANPSATVIKSIGIMFLIVLFGTGLTACETIKPFFTDAKNQLESIIAITAAGKYDVEGVVKKDGVPLVSFKESWNCATSEGKLSGCHKVVPQQLRQLAPPQ